MVSPAPKPERGGTESAFTAHRTNRAPAFFSASCIFKSCLAAEKREIPLDHRAKIILPEQACGDAKFAISKLSKSDPDNDAPDANDYPPHLSGRPALKQSEAARQ